LQATEPHQPDTGRDCCSLRRLLAALEPPHPRHRDRPQGRQGTLPRAYRHGPQGVRSRVRMHQSVSVLLAECQLSARAELRGGTIEDLQSQDGQREGDKYSGGEPTVCQCGVCQGSKRSGTLG